MKKGVLFLKKRTKKPLLLGARARFNARPNLQKFLLLFSKRSASLLPKGVAQTIPALDGLRGVAALIVLVSHFSNDFAVWHGNLGHGAGQTGVMLFFVLSGFLMAHLHIDTDFTAASLRSYAVRRVARVYPLFLVVAAAFELQNWLGSGGGVKAGLLIPWLRQVLLIDPGFSVLWTVRVEILFYAAFVGIWWLFRVTGRRVVLAALLSAVVMLSTGSLQYSGMFFASARFFLFGVISALLLARAPQPRHRGGFLLSALALMAFASIPLSFPPLIKMMFGADTQPWHNNLVAAQIVLLFNLVLRDHGWLNRLLSAPAARWLGRVSYSLYLLQPFVLQCVLARLPAANPVLSGAAVLLTALMLAGISNRLIERPAQAWVIAAARYFSRPEPRQAAT